MLVLLLRVWRRLSLRGGGLLFGGRVRLADLAGLGLRLRGVGSLVFVAVLKSPGVLRVGE